MVEEEVAVETVEEEVETVEEEGVKLNAIRQKYLLVNRRMEDGGLPKCILLPTAYFTYSMLLPMYLDAQGQLARSSAR